MVREKQENWTATAITIPTLNGLKVSAAENGRSIGQELEFILVQKHGIKRLSEQQFNTQIKQIEHGKA